MDYKNAKIYSIRSHKTDLIYIGSTTQTLKKRFSVHKSKYKKYLETNNLCISSYKIFAYGDAYIELIKNYPCKSREELNKEEGRYIKELNSVNKNKAGRTVSQWLIDNKEILCEKRRIKIYCECGCHVTKKNIARHKRTKKHNDLLNIKYNSMFDNFNNNLIF